MYRVFSTVVVSLLLLAPPALAAEPSPEGIKFFETKIRPVLIKRCYECHSAEALKNKKLEGELLLDTRESALKGGETGPRQAQSQQLPVPRPSSTHEVQSR